jgi:MFS family permease
MNVLTFYPLYVLDNYGDGISTTMTSVALGCFEFSTLVFTPTHMYTSRYLGRKKGLLVGIACMLVANTGLGALSLIPKEEAYGMPFFWLTGLVRLISGFGDSLAVLICFSLIGS